MTTEVPPSLWSSRHLPVTVSVLTVVALAAFDTLAVVAVLPEIAAELGEVGLLPWTVTAYLLTSTISAVAAGPVIDAVGPRRSFRYSVVLFVAAGVACALADTMPLLVGARAFQGIGGGMVVAVALSTVGLAYPAELRTRALAANSAVWGGMAVGAPAVAALFVGTVGWRGVFLVNLPIGLVAALLGWSRLPDRRPDAPARVRVDARGLALLTVVTGASLVGLTRFSAWSVPALAVAALAAWGYWRHAGRARAVVLERRYATRLPFGGINAGFALAFGGVVGLDIYLPVFVQGGLGRSELVAAFSVVALSVGWTSGSFAASRVLRHWSAVRLAVVAYGILLPPLVVGLAVYGPRTPLPLLWGLSALQGLGIGLLSTSMVDLLQGRAEPGEIGRASAAHQFLRGLANTYGSALAGAAVLLVVGRRLGSIDLVQDLLAGEAGAVAGEGRAAVAQGFRLAHLGALAMAGAGLAATLAVRRHLRGPGRDVPAPA